LKRLNLPQTTTINGLSAPPNDKFLQKLLPKFKRVYRLNDRGQRDKCLCNRNGVGLVAFSCLVFKDPHFLNSAELDFDCRGSVTVWDQKIEIAVGEIKSTANPETLKYGFAQLMTRLKFLEAAAKILFPTSEVGLTGILFVGPKLPDGYTLPDMKSEMEEFISPSSVMWTIVGDLL
jgi:hypothetical protein